VTESVKELVRRHWEGRAATFDEGASHGLLSDEQRAAWIGRVREWAGPDPVDALDVGCGTGFFALLLAGLGHRPVGVDLADAMLARAREKAAAAGLDVDFRSADAEHLPLADGSFDLVIERHVIWTLPDPPRALAEWARVLRPGGRLVLVEGDWRSPGNPDYAPIRDSLPLYGGRPAAELEALVRAHGFEHTQVEPLMTAALWVEEPDRDRYALHALV
jgi:ubiquinone/menaquinone biosynthesis C-methylase UbiE